jgi:hypothetical protein
VNRSDFQALAGLHLQHAKALLDAQLHSGAYYMCAAEDLFAAVSDPESRGARMYRIVEELSKRQVHIAGAFWYHYEDDWKLVVVSPDVEDKGPKALYTMISQPE